MARQEKRGFGGYKGPTRDTVRAKAAGGGGYDSYIKREFKRYKIKDGKNLIRVLPPTWEDADYHACDVFINYGIGPDNASYLSLSKHGKGKDPLAEARIEANRDGDEEVAKQLQPRERRLMWIVDRMDEEEGPQIMDAPITLDKAFANLSFDEDTGEVVDITDPDKGCDIRFFREGKGLNVKYEGSKIKLLKPSPVSEDDKQQDEWLGYVTENPVPDCLNFYDYEHISQVFNGSVKSKSDDDDEDVKPRKNKPSRDDDAEAEAAGEKRKPGKKATHRDDEDDDESEAEAPKARRKSNSDDDDEADEQPTSARRGSRKPSNEDAPFDGDDDDDEEVKPRQRSKSKSTDDDEDDVADKGPKPGSLREKLKARRKSVEADDDE